MGQAGEPVEKVLAELGEEWLLTHIQSTLKHVKGGRLPIGDDAIELPAKGEIIASGDMLVSSTDVPPGMTPKQIGFKAVTSVVSDFAAKGAHPLYFLIELGLPSHMKAAEFKDLWSGIIEAARLYGGEVVAGDTNQACEVVIGVVGIGYSEAPMPRGGARPGDIVAVTGAFGKTFTGLHAVLNAKLEDRWKPLIDAVLNPRARLLEGLTICHARLASASIDSSDGLEACLYELSRSSGVGFKVSDPPIDPLAQEYAEIHGLNLLDVIFRGGEEYELVITLPPEKLDEAVSTLKNIGCNLTLIGEATHEPSITVKMGGRSYELRGRGWTHFKRRAPTG
ncbi:MAG: thiamine-phosphate kinase [Nitrososphaerota archaeon]